MHGKPFPRGIARALDHDPVWVEGRWPKGEVGFALLTGAGCQNGDNLAFQPDLRHHPGIPHRMVPVGYPHTNASVRVMDADGIGEGLPPPFPQGIPAAPLPGGGEGGGLADFVQPGCAIGPVGVGAVHRVPLLFVRAPDFGEPVP